MNFAENVRKYIERNFEISESDIIIVGLSGGADSVCLLHVLKSLGYHCHAAHCNFHLRGEESERDENFVTDLTKTWNVPLYKTNFDTKAVAAERKISIEMAARDLRYAWFEEIRKQQNAKFIAVAHHADDGAETFFLNLIRGTGIKGLCGISPKNGNVIRPLLCTSREEIRRYLQKKNLPHVEDSSNGKIVFLRNKIRLEIIPQLKKINTSFAENLNGTIRHLSDVRDIYEQHISQAKKRICKTENDFTYINIPKLKAETAPKSVLFETLKDFGFRPAQTDDIWQAADAESGKRFFSEKFSLTKDRNHFIISKLNNNFETKIGENIRNISSPTPLTFEIFERNETFVLEKNPNIGFFDFDKLAFPLTLRNWQSGDSFFPLGMKQRKKISDFFINQKFSLPQKENTFLLLSGAEIAWIVGVRPDNRFKITDKTRKILKIAVKTEENGL